MPEEFEEACDKLVFVCPSWKWQKAIDKKHEFPELKPEKQFLTTSIISHERAKNALNNIEIIENVGRANTRGPTAGLKLA